ncbi:MAG: hypothetical protein IJV22_00540 [Bacteroidales bacterium]|nr:hypothetical protein [Bacteroidales bacterium]
MLAIMGASCSRQNTKWLNVQYHNTTCHYNVWWNGNESLKSGIRQLHEKAINDYTQILPIVPLGTQEQALTVKSQMDKAVEKGIKGIKTHSIYVKGREYVKYVKKCYLLTAYATFYEQDYAATDNTCRLIISQYSGTREADEARILLARSQCMQKQYSDAELQFDQLVNALNAGSFTAALADQLYIGMVECCLPQEKFKKAVQYLRLAIDETRGRKNKARLYFVMAQVYQQLEKRQTATKYYRKVLDCRPSYVMSFNAKINAAACSDVAVTNVAEVDKELNKMLRDRKNMEYLDQIYYAKGELYLGVKDAQKACDNYKLSVAAAPVGSAQKAKSALKMADVLYDVFENYKLAYTYYDTAMQIITLEYPHYDEIRERYYLLSSLVEFTDKIALNDSLLNYATMDSVQRDSLIRITIENLKQREKAEREQLLQKELRQDAQKQTNTLQGDWYFYNTNTVQKGKNNFRSKWGNRLLEDNWFLEKKELLTMGQPLLLQPFDDDEAAVDSTAQNAQNDSSAHSAVPPRATDSPDDPHNVAFYLKDLPTTTEQMDSMHSVIATSLLNAGYIYYDGIQNVTAALQCYLRMADDYSDNSQIVQAFYQLYRIYSKQGNTPSANYYRDMILMGFPDSDYANLIRDENYYKQLVRRSQQAQEDYYKTYVMFRRRRYEDVIAASKSASESYPNDAIVYKFKYWEGLAYLAQRRKSEAISTYEDIISHNDDTAAITVLAQEQLAYIKESEQNRSQDEVITKEDERMGVSNRAESTLQPKTSKRTELDADKNAVEEELPLESRVFRYRENMQHYVIIIVNDKRVVATQLQYRIADFNSANYANSGLRSSPLMFTDTTQMLTIHRFKDAAEAMLYYKHLLMEGSPLLQLNPRDYSIYAISTQNYTTFYKRKDEQAYRAFFERFYQNKK